MKTNLPRIYLPLPLQYETTVTLTPEAFQHVVKSLRLRDGDTLILFNGEGGEYRGILHIRSKKEAAVELISFDDVERESVPYIHLGQCLSRHERMDYAIQKSVEVGVSEITPILSERCQAKIPADRLAKRMAHWQQVIISACEQCGRTRIPQLNLPQALANWVAEADGDKLICDWSMPAWSPKQAPAQVSLLIGPEGGLSSVEQQQAVDQGFLGLSLGVRTLRTETAPVVAIVLIQQANSMAEAFLA